MTTDTAKETTDIAKETTRYCKKRQQILQQKTTRLLEGNLVGFCGVMSDYFSNSMI